MENKQTETTTTEIDAPKSKRIRNSRKDRTVYNAESGVPTTIPGKKLTKKSQPKDVVKRVNDITKALDYVASNVAELVEYYGAVRRRRVIDTKEIATLARKGLGKHAIATLLGFESGMFSQRKDLEEAFQIGLAELAVVISDRQMELMLTTKGPILPIFLGKNYLGQKDTPDTQVNVVVNTGDDYKEKLKAKLLGKSADVEVIAGPVIPKAEPIEAEFTEVKTGTDA